MELICVQALLDGWYMIVDVGFVHLPTTARILAANRGPMLMFCFLLVFLVFELVHLSFIIWLSTCLGHFWYLLFKLSPCLFCV